MRGGDHRSAAAAEAMSIVSSAVVAQVLDHLPAHIATTQRRYVEQPSVDMHRAR